jgi:hypothetical protein
VLLLYPAIRDEVHRALMGLCRARDLLRGVSLGRVVDEAGEAPVPVSLHSQIQGRFR